MFLFGVKKESNALVRSCLFEQAVAGNRKANKTPVIGKLSLWRRPPEGARAFPGLGGPDWGHLCLLSGD